MTKTLTWTAEPLAAGAVGPIIIRAPDDRTGSRVVCEIPGRLLRQLPDGSFERLISEEDIAHARLIMTSPRLLASLELARAALPDAWFAVRSGVPREVIEEINATITAACGRTG